MALESETKAPICVGIIMDGNRRWAQAHGLPTLQGHEKGFEKLKEVLGWGQARGIRHLVVYAFSTENWGRAEEEVSYLMNLIRRVFARQSKELEEIKERGGRLRFIGDRGRFAPDIQEVLAHAEEETKRGECTLWIGLSYGGRPEIVAAVNKLLEEGRESVGEEDINNALWSAGMPDPDLIIRTSGEQRLSGFLPWQSVYSELFFTKTYWPDFSEDELDGILAEYAARERRRGK